jgi:hypothetical protein
MKENLFRRSLVVGIIVLFVGMSIVPSSGRINVITQVTNIEDGSLSGFVNDTSDKPIEGALIRVYFHGNYSEDYSDSDGYYHVIDIPICYCMKNTTCSKVGYKTERVSLSIAENTTHDFILSSVNQPPYPPTNPEPEDDAENIVVDPELSVVVFDPDFEMHIKVEFYDASDDSYIGKDYAYSNNVRVYCDWKNLRPCTTYSWYAVAGDTKNTTKSDTWNFTTGIENNTPPSVPIINGPTIGRPHQKYHYTFISTDPDDHDVYYEIDWGDGKYDTIGPYLSNVIKNKDHTWDDFGNFTIRARTKDVYGVYSDWGEYIITMPRNKIIYNNIFQWFLERYPLLNLLFQRLTFI